ncbi:hypothetical protein RV134_350148 [Roseovarius sp. EC-HK134]|nr:hypothetical protein RV420_400428 [Roseovarius sp. EC-SD190]VVT28472.1 hypothetical protein RV134_350148 [Roseovarius sp. EC-HK134]
MQYFQSKLVAGGRNRLTLPDLRCMVWSTAQKAERSRALESQSNIGRREERPLTQQQ